MLATAKVVVWEDGGSELESGEGAQNDGGFGMLELWSSDVSSSLGLVCTSERNRELDLLLSNFYKTLKN
jgi:hypothetical protein